MPGGATSVPMGRGRGLAGPCRRATVPPGAAPAAPAPEAARPLALARGLAHRPLVLSGRWVGRAGFAPTPSRRGSSAGPGLSERRSLAVRCPPPHCPARIRRMPLTSVRPRPLNPGRRRASRVGLGRRVGPSAGPVASILRSIMMIQHAPSGSPLAPTSAGAACHRRPVWDGPSRSHRGL